MPSKAGFFLRFVPVVAVGVGALALSAPAASAATTSTFTLSGGSLSISQPTSANLGTAATGATSLSGPLGNVTVTDTRGALAATWTATVSSSNFTTGTATTYETVTNSNVAYVAGLPTSSTGLGTFTPGTLNSMSAPGTAGGWVGTAGNNSVTWDPTITFTLSPSQVVGTYTGTITHSVA